VSDSQPLASKLDQIGEMKTMMMSIFRISSHRHLRLCRSSLGGFEVTGFEVYLQTIDKRQLK